MKNYLNYLKNLNYLNYLQRPVILAVIGAVLFLAVGTIFLIHSRSQASKALGNQTDRKITQEEVKKLVLEVGKLIDLPTGEDPTVATVTDITKLKDQPFFQKAKNGDKVLIYTNARKAILYDPQAKKVIDVAPINIGSGSAQASQAKITLRNGTTAVGLTTKTEDLLKKSIPQLNVVGKDNASKNDYEKTLVVVLNSAFKDTALSLVNLLKGSSTSDLPSEETKPKDTDILIILGKDRVQ